MARGADQSEVYIIADAVARAAVRRGGGAPRTQKRWDAERACAIPRRCDSCRSHMRRRAY